MALILNIFQIAFVFLFFGLVFSYAKSKHIGILLAALTFGAAALTSNLLDSWCPLGIGFGIAWAIRLTGLDPSWTRRRRTSLDKSFAPGATFFAAALSKQAAGDWRGAVASYTLALDNNPFYFDAYYNRAIARYHIEPKDSDGSLADFTKAIELNPKSVDAHYSRGIAKRAIDDNEGAIEDFTRAIELDPRHANAFLNRGCAFGVLGNEAKAWEDVRTAVELGSEEARRLLDSHCVCETLALEDPAPRISTEEGAGQRETVNGGRPRHHRVLVVDDEPGVRDLIVDLLRSEEYIAAAAGDGDEALRMLQVSQFDLVATDIMMPRMNGLTLLTNIKNTFPEMKVVVISGLADEKTKAEAYARGALDYIIVAFRPEDVLGSIRKHVLRLTN